MNLEQNDNDYMDDNIEKLARKKMKNDAMKRAFAVNGMLMLFGVQRGNTFLNIFLSIARLRAHEKGIGYLCILLSRGGTS